MVTLQFVASDLVLRHLIYSQATGTVPENGSGGGNYTHLKKFMRLLSVL